MISTAVLDYANPRPFFVGTYRFRSWNAAVDVVVVSAFGLAFGYGARGGPPGSFSLSAFIGVVSAACLLWAGYMLWGLIAGREDLLRITEDGIEYVGRLWSWRDVSYLGGTTHSNGVSLECHLGPGTVKLVKFLPITPLLTVEQYVALMRVVAAHVSHLYPHVTIEPTPRRPSS